MHYSIKAIYISLGEFGAAQIGSVFSSLEMQDILALKDTEENHRKAATLEYNYWVKVYNDKNASWNDHLGGLLGKSVGIERRVEIQIEMARLRAIMSKVSKSNVNTGLDMNRFDKYCQLGVVEIISH